MRTRKIKTLLALSLTLVLAVSTTACNTTTQPASTSGTTSQSSAINSSTTSGEVSISQKGTFDYDEVCQKIELNGKKVSVPFSVKDLGKEYSINYNTVLYVSNNDGTVNAVFDVMCNGIKVLDAQIHRLSVEYKTKNKKIDDIVINLFSQDNDFLNTHLLSIDGIFNGDDISKVVEKFGESQETTLKNDIGAYRYFKSNDQRYGVRFCFEKNKIFSIMYKYDMYV